MYNPNIEAMPRVLKDALNDINLPNYWIVTIISDDNFYVIFESLLNSVEEVLFFKALSSTIDFNSKASLSNEFGIYSILS